MAKVLITIEYKNAEGNKQYLSVTAPSVSPEAFSEAVSEAADVLGEYGVCNETESGHYVFVPAHAIYRADFEMIQGEQAK